MHALLEDAAAHYRGALRASPEARAYLQGRGIGGAIAARFGLGYARDAWRDLGDVFERYAPADVEACGLVGVKADPGERGAGGFDRFRDRIMFPIRDRTGALVGFGGRVLEAGDGSAPKYLNSPEGPAFRKRELLYGFFEAAPAIGAARASVVVEGYMDVVAVAQAGVAHCVGSLGTACTAAQLAQLFALAPGVIFCFDGDAAGRRAAARALEAALPLATAGRSIKFAFLPDGHDPDSYVREFGAEAFRSVLLQAMPLQAYLAELVTDGCELEHAEGRVRCAARARPYWQAIPAGRARDSLRDFCAGVLRVERHELEAQWSAAVPAAAGRTRSLTNEAG